MRIKEHTEWKPMAVDLHSTLRSGSRRVSAKTSIYRGRVFNSFDSDFPVTAFVTPNGDVWIGPEKQFYIETDTGVLGVGGRFLQSAIIWAESLMKAPRDPKHSLEKLIGQFEREIDGNSLIIADEAGPSEWGQKHVIRLVPPLEFEVFSITPPIRGDPPKDPKIVGIELTGNTVRLDLSARLGQYKAAVWIDLNTKKLLKAEENGKQLFPK